MKEPQRLYRSYLLRLWQAEQGDGWIWRCSLEETLTGEQRTFTDLHAMVRHILEEIEDEREPPQEVYP